MSTLYKFFKKYGRDIDRSEYQIGVMSVERFRWISGKPDSYQINWFS